MKLYVAIKTFVAHVIIDDTEEPKSVVIHKDQLIAIDDDSETEPSEYYWKKFGKMKEGEGAKTGRKDVLPFWKT